MKIYRIYKINLMKKVSTLKKIQLAMKTFVPPFFNHFSLRPNRKERVVMRVMRKKLKILRFSSRCFTN